VLITAATTASSIMAPKPEGDVVADSNDAVKVTDSDDKMDNVDMEEVDIADTNHSKRSTRSEGGGLKKHSREVPLVELKLQNICYSPVSAAISKGKEKKRIAVLQNVSTTISPYKLTAIMGPSGSGKTSFMSVAADLVRSDDILEGSLITANGEEGHLPKRLIGVVWQDDLLLSNLTVEENIYFAARLKTPEETPDSEVRQVVEETMEELGLTHVRSSLVGSSLAGRGGISGGERKRVAVASELVVRPSLLILDEPTSGLDATTALALLATLRDLANMGHSVAVVIHQPRTTIYNMFDHLLLLSKGHTIYNGPPSKVRAYLESCPSVTELPPETGIADWLMDIVTEDERRPGGAVLWQRWAECSENKDCALMKVEDEKSQNNNVTRTKRRMSSLKELREAPKFNTGFRMQLRLLTQRTIKQQRGEKLTVTAAILQFTYLFFSALLWWRLPDNTGWIFERNSLLFFIIIAQSNGIVVSAVTVFQQERALLRRERAKKMYAVLPYFLAKTASDMTNNILLPLLYGMVVYWTAGFRPTAEAYFKFIIAFYLTISTAQSMGLWLSIAIPSMQIALILAPPITLFFMIMGGFYIPISNMHIGIQWASWVSFARYGYSALIINEYGGRDIPCTTDDITVQIGNSNACPLPGEEVIDSMGYQGVAESYWFNIGMIMLLQILFRVAAYVSLRRSK
jgi:ABC-type multidrug transport system ATPase subunit